MGVVRPRITATVIQLLSVVDVNVFDIGLTVIHDSISLGMLIQIPPDSRDEQTVKNAIQKVIDELDMTIRFVNVPRESYEHWVGQQGKRRHIVTLLARRITADHISRLSRVVADNELNIDKITRLSGRVPLDSIGS